MATTRNIQMNYFNGTDYDTLYPQINLNNSVGSLSFSNISGNLDLSRTTGTLGPSRVTGFLPTTGGTLTGNVNLNTTPTSNSHLVDKEYVDNKISDLETEISSSGGDKITTVNGTMDLSLFKQVPILELTKVDCPKIDGEYIASSSDIRGQYIILINPEKDFYIRQALISQTTYCLQKIQLSTNVSQWTTSQKWNYYNLRAENSGSAYYDNENNELIFCEDYESGYGRFHINFNTGAIKTIDYITVDDYRSYAGVQFGNYVYGLYNDRPCLFEDNKITLYYDNSTDYINDYNKQPKVIAEDGYYFNFLSWGRSDSSYTYEKGFIGKVLNNRVVDNYLEFGRDEGSITLSSGDNFVPKVEEHIVKPSVFPSGYTSHGQSGIALNILSSWYPFAFEFSTPSSMNSMGSLVWVCVYANNIMYIMELSNKLLFKVNNSSVIKKDNYLD